MSESEAYKRGAKIIDELLGKTEQRKQLDELYFETTDQFDKYVKEFAFGEIYSRPLLDRKIKQFAILASLVTSASIPQLKLHIHASLNLGLTEQEIVEVILLMIVYAGFMRAGNAMTAAKEVFAERKNVSS